MRRALLALALTLGCSSTSAQASDASESEDSTATSETPESASGRETENGESGGSTTGEPLDPSFDDKRILNIAHRGGVDDVPKPPLLAYAHTLELGADLLEVDLQITADGVPQARHDDVINEEDDMRELIAWGVEGIITDRPNRLEDSRKSEGMP